MFPGETILEGEDGREPPITDPHVSAFQVMTNGNEGGWYIGTLFSYDGCEACVKEYGPTTDWFGYQEPNSRETGYFDTKEEATQALEMYKLTGRLFKMRTE